MLNEECSGGMQSCWRSGRLKECMRGYRMEGCTQDAAERPSGWTRDRVWPSSDWATYRSGWTGSVCVCVCVNWCSNRLSAVSGGESAINSLSPDAAIVCVCVYASLE